MEETVEKQSVFQRIEQSVIVRSVRGGLVNMIPVLIIGAFALVLNTFPVQAYQNWLKVFAGGALMEMFDLVNKATFGVLSLYMTFSISRSYMKVKSDPDAVNGGAIVSSFLSFFILAGAGSESFGLENLGPKSVFLAIITGFCASAIYLKLEQLFRHRYDLFSRGADREFNRMLSALFPIVIVGVFFALINLIATRAFNVDSFRDLMIRALNHLFSKGENGFFKGFCFVLLSSVLWFFGIHGSDTLEGVMQTYFTPGLAVNQAAVSMGNAPTEILTKQFFDCFVLMGGCGSAICLLIALLLFSRSHARRRLGLTAAFPMIFNINEMMVFGLPVILNPVMLIPFLATPLVCYSIAYFAIYVGWVPMITSSVEWTTPIILGGYYATGSAAGAILQLVNVIVGVAIYMPFVFLLDRQTEKNARRDFASFLKYYTDHESELSATQVTLIPNTFGNFAKSLCADIRFGLKRPQIVMAYQPQYDASGKCTGVESLLRWKHPVFGMLYPPLVIKLAEEGGFLPALEERIFQRVLEDEPMIRSKFGADIKISVNITGITVITPRFLQFCERQNAKNPFKGRNICIEVTEQAALSFNDESCHALQSLREMDLLLAIDDFSMGKTSVHYLKNNLFDIIKLDGSLVQGLLKYENCREIIRSVTRLADSLNMSVIAEFVETEEQRSILQEIGCVYYQGYLYSPAVFLDNVPGDSK